MWSIGIGTTISIVILVRFLCVILVLIINLQYPPISLSFPSFPKRRHSTQTCWYKETRWQQHKDWIHIVRSDMLYKPVLCFIDLFYRRYSSQMLILLFKPGLDFSNKTHIQLCVFTEIFKFFLKFQKSQFFAFLEKS